jgi:hypothetical protein
MGYFLSDKEEQQMFAGDVIVVDYASLLIRKCTARQKVGKMSKA